VNIKTLVCLRCGHGSDPKKPWVQRSREKPRACWKCHSPYWDRPREANAMKKTLAVLLIGLIMGGNAYAGKRVEYLISSAFFGAGIYSMLESRGHGSDAEGFKAQYDFSKTTAQQTPEAQLIYAKYEHERHFENTDREYSVGLFLIGAIIFTHALFADEVPKPRPVSSGFEVAPKLAGGASVKYRWAF